MKKQLLRLVSCIITVCLTIGMLCYFTDLMERKSSDQKYEDFFKQKQDFDVLFMGSSHVINGVFPMELWNDYGIVSYNFGGHSNQIATTYWVMENALEWTNPKVVVVDCMAVEGQTKCSDKSSYLHLSLDAFPISMTKAKAVWDLLDDPVMDEDIANGNAKESDESRIKIGLLWDYSVYHSRWNEIMENDFEPGHTYEKGAESRIAVTKGTLNRISTEQKLEPGTTGDIYLRKIIEDCQSRGIDVLLTYLPFPATEKQQKTANYINDLASEYGVNYLNFLDIELIDYQTDLYDENSHLNPSGARKVTDYLGNYLVEHYNIKDQRNNEVYCEWHTDYSEYIAFKNKNLKGCNDIVNYLMLLSGDDIQITMDIRNKNIFKNDLVLSLLENLGIDKSTLSTDTDFILIKNRGAKTVVLNNYRDNAKTKNTEFGEIVIRYDDATYSESETSYYRLYVDEVENLVGDINDETGLQINVYRKGEMIDSVKFVYDIGLESLNVNVIATNR